MDEQNTDASLQAGHETGSSAHWIKTPLHEALGSSKERPMRTQKRKRTQEPGFDLISEFLPRGTENAYSNAHPNINRGSTSSGHLVLHRVVCDRQKNTDEDHSQHLPTTDYDDEPKLYAKDDRASALRGRNYIRDVEEYLERQEAVTFIVFKVYDCRQHHYDTRKQFDNVAPETIARASFLKLKPWFHILPKDSDVASPISEEISIVEEALAKGADSLVSLDVERLGSWDEESSLRAPYDYFYHCHRRMRELLEIEDTSSRTTLVDLSRLLDYIQAACHAQWEVADRLFEQGLVAANTFSKLFHPGEVIVREDDGVPHAYLVDKVQRQSNVRAVLSCWTLAFDGRFRRVQNDIIVEWPGGTRDKIAIRRLTAWPLRMDQGGLKERLVSRGSEFWQCRSRRLVNYQAPAASSFELPTVSSNSDCLRAG